MLHFFWCKVCEQHLIAFDFKSTLLHIVDFKLFTVVDWIVCVSNQLKSNVVAISKTASAFSRNVIVFILNDLITKKRKGYIVQLKIVQTVFTTHIQEQINP